MIDYDDTPMSKAEFKAWRQDEELCAEAWERSFGGIGNPPDWLPRATEPEPDIESLRAALEHGVLHFRKEIALARDLERKNRAASAVAAAKRVRDAAKRDVELRQAALAYRKSNPSTSTRDMAAALAKKLGRKTGTVRDRLRRIGVR